MPLYEYGCSNCQKVHEIMQKFSDAPLAACPDCQGPVEKLVSLSSFALKGSGWYTTDYKRAAPAAKLASGEGKGEAKSDAKAAAAKPAATAAAVEAKPAATASKPVASATT